MDIGKTINSVVNGDAVDVLREMPNDTFDLTVFSPPYDNLRDYNGYTFDLHALGEQLYRVTKEGGIVAMVIQDQTINGHKSLTSFRTIVSWCDNAGFGLFECLIYSRQGTEGGWWSKRFRVDHEYMPIFLKGRRPNYFDKQHLKVPCKYAGTTTMPTNRQKDGSLKTLGKVLTINPTKCRGTIWHYITHAGRDKLKKQHPATFPDKIPHDFIRAFTKEGGCVLDPMCGSGSTLVAAQSLNRNYVGIDSSQEYCNLSQERLTLHSVDKQREI